MTSIGYARVSTTEQNPDLQVDALRAAGCTKVFVEKASGAREDRPELARALEYLREGDVLVVWKLDRLGRSLRHLLDIVHALGETGVGFCSVNDGIDTTTAAGRLLFQIVGAIGEFERSLIIERTHAGLAAARMRGRQGGRPSSATPEKLARARALLLDGGLTASEAAGAIGISRATLYRWLRASPPAEVVAKRTART